MRGLSQFGRELSAIARNKKVLIPVIAVLVIPVLYSAMFLGAFWDPYEKLSDLPVAVVNLDEGADFDGKSLQVGKELSETLAEKKDFKWAFVTKEEAQEGLHHNDYYMAIEIPADFSEKVTTLTKEEPTPAEITFLPNEGYNFLAAQIGKTAIDRIKTEVSKNVTEAYTETVFGQVATLADGLGKASEGAGKIADGTTKAKDGAQLLEENLSKLAQGTVKLQDGVAKLQSGGDKLVAGSTELSAGTAKLSSGLGQLSDAHNQLLFGVKQLGTGASDLQAGAVKLSGGLEQLAAGADKLEAGAKSAEQGADSLVNGLKTSSAGADKLEAAAAQLAQGLEQLAKDPALAEDENVKKLVAASKQLAAGAESAAAGQEKLAAGAAQLQQGQGSLAAGAETLSGKLAEAQAGGEQLAGGAGKLAAGGEQVAAGMEQFGAKLAEAGAGSSKLAAGAEQLAGGSKQLGAGLGGLSDGVNTLSEGSFKLDNGARQVADGLLQLSDGTGELAGKLDDAAGKTAGIKGDDQLYDMFASPVSVSEDKVTEVPNYGTGFAPYFISLGLFVGALMLSIVLALKEPAGVPANGWSWFVGKAMTMVVVGVIQSLIADAVLLYGLGLEVKSVPLFLLFSILTSITFMALIQFLVTALQHPGRFVAIVLLIFQLTSSAGTFPAELIPGWLQKAGYWLPMTYSVSGFKAVISSGDFSDMWHNAGILGLFTVLFALMTLVYLVISHRREYGGGDHSKLAGADPSAV
ncbi:YhgE/Pip domain-containing protein [Paenibacillus sp. GCM10023252]|uniref:YhgE/Pip domain-containing protein n=1 Tax=Paenibacillus sp. GCM10023252 TaxID=3252649 RepID=UPI00361F6B92